MPWATPLTVGDTIIGFCNWKWNNDCVTPILGIAGSLLVGPLLAEARRWPLMAMLVLMWMTSGSGLVSSMHFAANTKDGVVTLRGGSG